MQRKTLRLAIVRRVWYDEDYSKIMCADGRNQFGAVGLTIRNMSISWMFPCHVFAEVHIGLKCRAQVRAQEQFLTKSVGCGTLKVWATARHFCWISKLVTDCQPQSSSDCERDW